MGGFTPQAALAVIDLGLEIVQRQRQARAAKVQINEETAAKAAEIEADRAEAARERDARLRRTVAAQRARFAAGGLDPAQGSAGAVLDGLVAEADRETAEDRRRADSRLGLLERRRRRLDRSAARTSIVSLLDL